MGGLALKKLAEADVAEERRGSNDANGNEFSQGVAESESSCPTRIDDE